MTEVQDVEAQDVETDMAGACHQMLLRLAGRAPDDLLARCRGWLARGELEALARGVTFWAVAQDVSLTEADVLLLSSLLAEADADFSGLTQLRLSEFEPLPYYGFAPEIPAGLVGGAGGTSGSVAKARAKVEAAALKAVAAEPGAIGLWGAWRFPSDGAPWPPPKCVFVIEVSADVDEPGVVGRVQERLAAAGEADPQIEVYRVGCQLPTYQEFARTYGALLWAAEPDPGLRVAAVFDEVDAETGPRFRSDHPALDAGEAAKIVSYLQAGEALLVTTWRMDDVVEPAQVYSVPASFRTDGTWIWADASAYYAQRHLLEPDSGLLAHLRSNDYTMPRVDGVAVYRALQLLLETGDEEPEWTPEDDG
jgi:hypothetical protein